MTVERPLVCAIRCDRPGCTSCITVNHDITEAQAVVMAVGAGWDCNRTEERWTHQCPKHEQEGT